MQFGLARDKETTLSHYKILHNGSPLIVHIILLVFIISVNTRFILNFAPAFENNQLLDCIRR